MHVPTTNENGYASSTRIYISRGDGTTRIHLALTADGHDSPRENGDAGGRIEDEERSQDKENFDMPSPRRPRP